MHYETSREFDLFGAGVISGTLIATVDGDLRGLDQDQGWDNAALSEGRAEVELEAALSGVPVSLTLDWWTPCCGQAGSKGGPLHFQARDIKDLPLFVLDGYLYWQGRDCEGSCGSAGRALRAVERPTR